MKILVTGGAGYIGSHIVHELLESGHTPVVYDNLYSGYRTNVPDNVTLFVGDITDEAQLAASLSGMDCVMHLAGLKAAGESMTDPAAYAEKNICGTVRLLNAMGKAAVKHVIFSSSAAVYGEPSEMPITENAVTAPINFYGFAKLKTEELCQWYSRLGRIRYGALRYFNVVGYDVKKRTTGLEYRPNNFFPIMMEVIKGVRDELHIFGSDYNTSDGTAIRDYVHVNDLAKAHVLAMEYITEQNRDLTVNLGTASGLSVKEAISATERIAGISIKKKYTERRPGDSGTLICDYSRAKKILDWKPALSDVDTIVHSMLDAYDIPHTA